MSHMIELAREGLTNLSSSPESDPTEGALLCLKIGDKYLVSVNIDIKAEPGKTQYAVVKPITGLSGELIPLLYPHIPDISRRSFQAMYRGRSDTQTPVYDIYIEDPQITEKIEEIVVEGKSGLALLTKNQLEFQQGYHQFHVSTENIYRGEQGCASEIRPLCLTAWGMSVEAPVRPSCLGLLTPRVSAEPSLLPEGVMTDIYEGLKKAVFSVETKDESNQYRLGEKDLQILRKHCLDPKSVDDLEKLLVIRRAIVLALKGIRSATESGIIVSSQNKAQDTFTWGLKLGVAAILLLSNGALNAVDDLNVKSVNESLSRILHHLVPLYQQDDRIYGLSGKFKREYLIDNQPDKPGLLSKTGDLVFRKIIDPAAGAYGKMLQRFGFGEQEERLKERGVDRRQIPQFLNTQLHDWVGLMAYKIAQAEEIAPFTVEMLPSQAAMDIPLLANKDFLPVGLNLGLLGTTWGVIRMVLSSRSDEINKTRRSLSSKMIASAVSDIVPILASMASVFIPDDQLALITTSTALTANHAAKQMGGTDEMEDSREALKDLRELLMHFNVTLVSDEAREEHCLRIMSREDAGRIYELNNQFKATSENTVIFDPSGKKERRFVLLDEAEARKNKYETAQPYSGSESISSGVRSSPRVPALLVKDFTSRMGDTTFLDRANLYLPASIYELNCGPRTGKSIILKSLADIFEHPEGTLLLGQEDTDFNIHGEPDKSLIGYFDCAGEIYDFLPDLFRMDEQDAKKYLAAWEQSAEFKQATYTDIIADYYPDDREKAGAVAAFLKETGMFEDEEIVRYLSHDKLDQLLRSRLWVASAGLSKSPVLLLDDPFVADTFGRGIYKYYEEIEEILKKMKTQEPADANELKRIRKILKNIRDYSGYVRLDENADIIDQIESIHRAFQPVVRTCNYLSNLYWYQKRIIIISSSNSPETEGFHGVLRARGRVLAGTYTIRNHQLELLPEAD